MRRYRRFWGFRCPPSIITGISLAPGCSSKSEANRSFSLEYPVQAELVKIAVFRWHDQRGIASFGYSLSTLNNYWNFSRAWLFQPNPTQNKSVLKSCTFPPGFSFTSMKTSQIWNPGQNKYEPRPVS